MWVNLREILRDALLSLITWLYFIIPLSMSIKNDPLLRDLDPHVTLEEVNSMIALEYGQAMVINVRRADNEVIREFLYSELSKKN